MENNDKIMEDIIKLQLKTLEIKLEVARDGKRVELEGKIAELKKKIKPIESVAKKEIEVVQQPKPKKRVINKPVPKIAPVVDPVVEKVELNEPHQEVVDMAVEELVKIVDEEILEKAAKIEELPTVEEVEKEIEALPIVDFKFEKEIFLGTPNSDEQTKIDTLPKEEFNQDAEDLDVLKEAVEAVEAPVIKPPVVEKVVETTITTKKKRKYTKRKKAPIKVPAKK